MPDGLMYISLDEGFPVDRAARKMVLGASPEGGVLPEEMDRLQQIVHPLASRLGYTRPSISSSAKS
jgi:hypothetical protein